MSTQNPRIFYFTRLWKTQGIIPCLVESHAEGRRMASGKAIDTGGSYHIDLKADGSFDLPTAQAKVSAKLQQVIERSEELLVDIENMEELPCSPPSTP